MNSKRCVAPAELLFVIAPERNVSLPMPRLLLWQPLPNEQSLPVYLNFVNGTRNERDDDELRTFHGARLPTSGRV